MASVVTVSQLDMQAQAQGEDGISWDRETDVVVVGTGGGAAVAALRAHESGSSVVILEKAGSFGGTTAKSGGMFWIPNNPLMQRNGQDDPKEWALKYMARCAYPDRYMPSAENLGLTEREYALLDTYYDKGSEMVSFLENTGMSFVKWDIADYYADFSENRAPRGRGLFPQTSDGGQGAGATLMSQLQQQVKRRDIPILLQTPAERLILNDEGAVVGVQASSDEQTLNIKANQGAIFATGGFTQNDAMRANYLYGPVIGGCEVPGNVGDFLRMGIEAGAQLANVQHAYWAQVLLDQVLRFPSPPTDLFIVPGDSMIHVNKYGKRVYNEKQPYHNRTPVQFTWDEVEGEYPNQLMFMIWDQRTHEQFAGQFPIPTGGRTPPYLITGDSLGELAGAIDQRLAENADALETGNVRLHDDFVVNLQETIIRYNEFARNGVDEDFRRGELTYDTDWHTPAEEHDLPNITMYPLSQSGPYYAAVIGAGTLSTNGGPMINETSQVLDTNGNPIPGLYGAGSCISSPSGRAYWGGGGTIGPSMVTGYNAGNRVSQEAAKTAEADTGERERQLA